MAHHRPAVLRSTTVGHPAPSGLRRPGPPCLPIARRMGPTFVLGRAGSGDPPEGGVPYPPSHHHTYGQDGASSVGRTGPPYGVRTPPAPRPTGTAALGPAVIVLAACRGRG